MHSAANQDALGMVIGSVLFFSVTGWFQYIAARDLRSEAVIAKKRRKFRGRALGLVGIIAFAALVQILYILSILDVHPPQWSGGLFCVILGLIVIGFLIGNQMIGRVRKKRSP